MDQRQDENVFDAGRALADAVSIFGGSPPSGKIGSEDRFVQMPWWAILNGLLIDESERGTLRIPSVSATLVTSVEVLSDRGGAPTWRIEDASGQSYKLRVSSDSQVIQRITDFLCHALQQGWNGCARLLTSRPHAVLKTWVEGVPISRIAPAARSAAIARIGMCLADLHASGRPGSQPLVCSADNYNTIVTPGGGVVFVDLEACTTGVRWIDLIWAEELLCRTMDERSLLWTEYLLAAKLKPPCVAERRKARMAFLEWLRLQLCSALRRLPDNPGLLEDLAVVEQALQSDTECLLFQGN